MSTNTKRTYAVLGLGRYGMAVARELVNSGADLLAVDIDQETVNLAASELPHCKCADITEAEVIERLGIANADVVIIAMAGNLEASVMATMLCKEAGVKTVIAKCSNEMHRRILLRTGADKVVFPENESGIRLAKNLMSSGFIDVIELSQGVSMVELGVRDEWIGKSLIDLRLRKKYGMNIVAIRSDGNIIVNIDPEMPLEKHMELIVIANTSKLNRFEEK